MELRKALIASVLIASLAATSATAGEVRAPAAGGGSNDGEILAAAFVIGVIGWLIYAGSRRDGDDDGSTVSSSGATGDASGSGRQRGKLLMKF